MSLDALALPPAEYPRCTPGCQHRSPRSAVDVRHFGIVAHLRPLPGQPAQRAESKPTREERKAAAKARRTRG
jgi:hypothetical protein